MTNIYIFGRIIVGVPLGYMVMEQTVRMLLLT